MTPAAHAAEALLALADATDAAGPSPGHTTAALLDADRREAVAALRALAASLLAHSDQRRRAEAEAQILARREASALSKAATTPNALRRWARAWQAYARRAA